MDNIEVGEMISLTTILLLATNLPIACCAGVLAYLSMRAYLRYKRRSMLLTSLGFTIILFGSWIEETFGGVFGYTAFEAHMFESSVVGIGFIFLVYSIFGTKD
jgi:hypothetical protein